jgi:hypothetical protein
MTGAINQHRRRIVRTVAGDRNVMPGSTHCLEDIEFLPRPMPMMDWTDRMKI